MIKKLNINPEKICYIFDIDGTLTKPREIVSKTMEKTFISWSDTKQIFLCTGSDWKKVKEQISEKMLQKIKLIFCCMSNELRNINGEIIAKTKFELPTTLKNDLMTFLKESQFKTKTGNHLEYRSGMLNFSIVGRNATKSQRKEYSNWEKKSQERKKIVSFINENYIDFEASIGGSISIDIINRGADKGQIIELLDHLKVKKVVFVGDKCYEGGNDYGVIRELKKSELIFEWFNVEGPKETLQLINNNKAFGEQDDDD